MLTAKEKERVPVCRWILRKGDAWESLDSAALFQGRRVILFALPGAFTPTCSSSHLPRYQELASTFRALGIDEIVCLSVNDPFVMEAWQRDQRAYDILFLPDGNGEFSEKMGMLVDKRALGFGMRSWRYAMLVQDGIIEKMFVEPMQSGDPFVVSDADTMLHYLAPQLAAPPSVAVFTKPGCSFCAAAKEKLEQHGMGFEEIVLGQTATMIFIEGRYIGGSEELASYLDAEGSPV